MRAPFAQGADVLSDLQRRAFDFFWFEAHPKTGLAKDRAGNHAGDDYQIASVASTGFALAALPVAVENKWISKEKAEERARLTLKTVATTLTNHHGWYYHFVDWKTGARVWNCEVSSIDTALFLAGALFAGEYFGGEIQALANGIYERVDFNWMLTDGGAKPDEKTLSMGWRPENGFIKARWDSYSEHLILNILALGSKTHPTPAETWMAWKRNIGEYKGIRTFACGPLFVHQYSHAYLGLWNKLDASGHNYFETATMATLANRQFCADNGYPAHVWGLSATDKPDGGYTAYSAPPGHIEHDGTISPWNTAASIVFTPEIVLESVNHLYKNYPRLWGRYGFSSALNVGKNFYSRDVIGIDLGAALLMIENHRSRLVWNQFNQIPAIKRGMEKAGFK